MIIAGYIHHVAGFLFLTRNPYLATRNIIFQRKNNILAEIDDKLSMLLY